MNALVLHRQKSEHARQVEEFLRDFAKVHPDSKLEAIDVDTREGAAKAELYGVMSYPTVLALTDDGQLLKRWDGDTLPLMDEVAYYTH